MADATVNGQFAEELAELHDGSISLFVTLPVFRSLLVSKQRAEIVAGFEAAIAEHLAHLDGILGDVLVRRDRTDGDLTRTLFRSLTALRDRAASVARDQEIIRVLQQAQVFLMGSCSFALRFARQAHVERSVHVLEESLARIGSRALQFGAVSSAPLAEWSDAVA